MIIKRIKAAECKISLPHPIRLGPVEIKTRDFVVLRLETDSGLVGDAVSYPRGSSLLDSVGRLAPFALGSEVAMRRATIDTMLQSFVNGRPTFVKAAGLFDIALWDLAANSVDMPLFEMLGGVRTQAPMMAVAGYYLDQRTIEDVCDEVSKRVDEGYARIKIMISGTDLDRDRNLVEAARKIAGTRLCVDAHWVFRSLPAALHHCRALDEFDLAFIEDPFGPNQGELTGALQTRIQTPLAYGEDLPDAQSIHRAIEDIDYLRLDATTCGGVSTALALAEAAGHAGRIVLPHVFTSLHAQLAGAVQAIDAVEYIPIEVGACPIYELLANKPVIKDGMLQIDTAAGAGMGLNWDRVEHFATDEARDIQL
ncbi:mandelate racemase/muconate lactonizing enzyme family protein [Loktanella sp. Alg231-35]|uniref:mandelate racemase/muconate lactonizing enzyme family protein n=1 Tax=Loktanella sp. Alg231-35 TaxID=1922220 RepID=UPI000D55251E|nr:enolase C-terminal domain-like protein [Loktanella sp. Alg231-35]